jgi:hypothetical protein
MLDVLTELVVAEKIVKSVSPLALRLFRACSVQLLFSTIPIISLNITPVGSAGSSKSTIYQYNDCNETIKGETKIGGKDENEVDVGWYGACSYRDGYSDSEIG